MTKYLVDILQSKQQLRIKHVFLLSHQSLYDCFAFLSGGASGSTLGSAISRRVRRLFPCWNSGWIHFWRKLANRVALIRKAVISKGLDRKRQPCAQHAGTNVASRESIPRRWHMWNVDMVHFWHAQSLLYHARVAILNCNPVITTGTTFKKGCPCMLACGLISAKSPELHQNWPLIWRLKHSPYNQLWSRDSTDYNVPLHAGNTPVVHELKVPHFPRLAGHAVPHTEAEWWIYIYIYLYNVEIFLNWVWSRHVFKHVPDHDANVENFKPF